MLHSAHMGNVSFDGNISIDATAGADGVGGTSTATGSLPSIFGDALNQVLAKVGLAPPAGGSAPEAEPPIPSTVPVTTSVQRQLSAFADNPLHIANSKPVISLMHPISQESAVVAANQPSLSPVSALMNATGPAVSRLPKPVLYAGLAGAAFVGFKLFKRIRKGGLK